MMRLSVALGKSCEATAEGSGRLLATNITGVLGYMIVFRDYLL